MVTGACWSLSTLLLPNRKFILPLVGHFLPVEQVAQHIYGVVLTHIFTVWQLGSCDSWG